MANRRHEIQPRGWRVLIQETTAWKRRAKRQEKAIALALASLEEIRSDRWSIRQECSEDDCLICPLKADKRKRAEMAITALKKELGT